MCSRKAVFRQFFAILARNWRSYPTFCHYCGSWVSVEAPEWVPAVLAGAAPIERALTHPLTKALKYSPADQSVLVRIGHHDGQALISVIDRGVGIPAEGLPHIFERSYRA